MSQSSRGDIYIKLEFASPRIPGLASVDFRQLRWSSMAIRGQRKIISAYIVRGQKTIYSGWGWAPYLPGRYLPKN